MSAARVSCSSPACTASSFRPLDTAALAGAIAELVADRPRRAAMSAANRRRTTTEFSVEAMVRATNTCTWT
jgi:glycosyltransferase involved in cell wall biosynthesis